MSVAIDPHKVWFDVQAIKELSPLIHNITNYVVMEQTANSLLALGASPVMAHALEEVEEMAVISHSLVLNIGTLSSSWIEAMKLALQAANRKNIPVVLDPVGVGATSYRTQTAQALFESGPITAIRGNASEIVSLYGSLGKTKGVDSLLKSCESVEEAKGLALQRRCIVWMSGSIDVITDGKRVILIHNGHPLMEKVVGMGCTASAILGAFLAVNPNSLMGCAHAAVVMGIVGEIASEKSDGPGFFIPAFMDRLYALSLSDILERICIS